VAALQRVLAHRMSALLGAHRDDPEFGYRFLVDEAEVAGWPMARSTAWSLSAAAGPVSAARFSPETQGATTSREVISLRRE